jgi:hypothetical protein
MEYTEEFLKYVKELESKFHPITLPSIECLYIIFNEGIETEQDEKTTSKKNKKHQRRHRGLQEFAPAG